MAEEKKDECKTCYNEDFKKAIEKRTKKETKQTEEELEQLGLLERKMPLLKCPECGNEQPPTYRGYSQRCKKCNHMWFLIKGFEKENEKG